VRQPEPILRKRAVSPQEGDEDIDRPDLIQGTIKNTVQRENDRVHRQQRLDTVEPSVVHRSIGQQDIGKRAAAMKGDALVEGPIPDTIAGTIQRPVKARRGIGDRRSEKFARIGLVQQTSEDRIRFKGLRAEKKEPGRRMDRRTRSIRHALHQGRIDPQQDGHSAGMIPENSEDGGVLDVLERD